MSPKPILSVVVPAYNEAANFNRGSVAGVYGFLKERSDPFELILVDDGSKDATLALLEQFAEGKPEVRVIPAPHRGKGPAVAEGMLTAIGENRLFTDFDQSTPIQETEKLLTYRKKGFDIVIGSREIAGSKREAEPWYRHLMGKGFNFGVQLLTVRGIEDTQCGFKLFSAEATQDLFKKVRVTVKPQTDAFTGALDVELLYLAQKYGYKIAEVPVHWQHVQSARVNPLKDSFRMAKDVLKIRYTDLRGGYET